jgi:PAS domain S-box-containing protein
MARDRRGSEGPGTNKVTISSHPSVLPAIQDEGSARQGERLALALDAAETGLWEEEVETGRLLVDERWAALLGYGREELESDPPAWALLCRAEDFGRLSSLVARNLRGETDRFECEIRLHHRDGSWPWFVLRGRVSGGEAGGRPLSVIGTIVNVDRRKAAELAEEEQAARLSSLLDSLDDLVYFKDEDGLLLGCNHAFELFMGAPGVDLRGRRVEEFLRPDQAALSREQDALVLSREKPLRVEEWHHALDGSHVLLEMRKGPLRDREGRVLGISVLARDITARHDAEAVTELRLGVLEYSRGHSGRELARFAMEEIGRLAESPASFLCLVDEDEGGAQLQAWAGPGSTDSSSPPSGEARPRLSLAGELGLCVAWRRAVMDNEVRPAEALELPGGFAVGRRILVPVIRAGRVVGMLGVGCKRRPYDDRDLRLVTGLADQVWDIVQSRVSEDALAESDRSRELALTVTQAGLWTCHLREGRKEYDERWARIGGRCLAELEPITMHTWEELCHPEDFPVTMAAIEKHLRGETPFYEAEARLRHKDGGWVWVLDRGEVVEWDRAGRPLRMIGLMFDISRLKGVESRLRETVADKEVLLHELFHRTKNSMQLINAMMELKKADMEPGPVTVAFDEIQGKIIAMALVQEKIYQTGNLSTLDLGQYLADLVGLLEAELPAGEERPFFEVETESVPVSVDTAVPCGIIVSELISNAVLHAFPKAAKGRIGLSVSIDEDKEICIRVRDDGCGLPPGFDPRASTRVGLKTVIGIGEEQLRGVVRFGEEGGGFSFSLRFKDLYHPRRL